eukprot:5225076-Amphidinium_carterae.1
MKIYVQTFGFKGSLKFDKATTTGQLQKMIEETYHMERVIMLMGNKFAEGDELVKDYFDDEFVVYFLHKNMEYYINGSSLYDLIDDQAPENDDEGVSEEKYEIQVDGEE